LLTLRFIGGYFYSCLHFILIYGYKNTATYGITSQKSDYFCKNLNMAKHNILGKTGETIAADYLKGEGYTIRHCNWRSGHKELDIVAEKDGELVVVEVKTRTSTQFGNPEDAVTDRKIRNIVASTDAYLRLFDIDLPVRFDVITVTGDNGQYHIEHIPEAFFSPVW